GGSTIMLIRRDKFPGFPEHFRMSEDVTALAKFAAAGHMIRFSPEMTGYHVNTSGMLRNLKHVYEFGIWTAKGRRECPHLPGGDAVKRPFLSFGLWLARVVNLYRRTLRHGGRLSDLIWHTPAIVALAMTWNAGFSREAFSSNRQP